MRNKFLLAVVAVALSAWTHAQTDPLYLSDGDRDMLYVVQGGAIINSFPAVPAIRAFPIAVVDTIRVTGYATGEIGGEYTLAGVPTGTTYPLVQGDIMSDGATDGTTYNWGISFTGNVWRYDRNWANGVMQWSAVGHAGIAYDPTDGTLWLSRDRNSGISHYTATGALLGTFPTVPNLDWIMAYEPSSDSLWVSSRSSSTLTNYSKAGALLGSVMVPGMTPVSFYSGEFQSGPVARVLTVDATPTVVTAGLGGYAVMFDAENGGASSITVTAAMLQFADATMADVSSEYTVTPDPGNPTAIAPATTESFLFTVDVAPGATTGTITIDGRMDYMDSVSMVTGSDASADTPDTWDVVACQAPDCGDCNGDSTLSILDALVAAQHSAGLVVLAGVQFSNCNVFGALEPDPLAEVSILDALNLAQSAAGLPVSLVCC